ncbi:MAG: tryptophan synthase alpha chain [Hyphomicrobiaceae bacterium]|jgi:tryptophan synthase alpha chain
MGRITRCLDELRAEGRSALVPYFCVGDPDLDTTRKSVLAAVEAGADIIELGVPFSDPIADGPVIQAASQRALNAGSSLPRVLELAESLRRDTDVPLVLFGYYNPIFRYGDEALAKAAAAAGIDGILCSDLPPEEARSLVDASRANGVDSIFLLAPTSGDERIDAVAAFASGFIYFVSVTGVTGARVSAPEGIDKLVARVRERTGLAVGVGFGISTADQAAAVAGYAELVIVGSAIVRKMEEAGAERAPEVVREFVAELRGGLNRAAGKGS